MQSEIKVGNNVQGLALVIPTIKVWTGGVAFDRERDCPAAKAAMPPKELVRDGLLMVVREKVLNPFYARRKRVERAAEEAGYRLTNRGGVWAVSERAAIDMLPALQSLYAEWQQELDTLELALPQHYADREAEMPQWASLLKAGQLNGGQVRGRFLFNVSFLPNGQMQSLDKALQQGVGDALVEDHAAMLLDSIAKDAAELLDGAISTKAQVTQTTLGPVRKLIKKLHEYAFLDPAVEAIFDCWEPVVAAMPRTGVTTETEAYMVKTMLEVLSKPAVAIAYAKAIENNAAGEAAALIQNHGASARETQQVLDLAVGAPA